MSRSKRDLTEDETKLWRRVAATVKARRAEAATQARATEAPPLPPKLKTLPKALPKREPAAQSPRPKPGAPPADRGAEKRVRRGKLEIDATLDLHGHTQDSGRAALRRFIRAAEARGDRTLIVITGAGRAGEGVLRKRLPDWLAELSLSIAGFAQAHRAHGGAGAFYVFLKRKR